MNILGIDDAGKGCLIGSMVLAGVVIPKEDYEELKKIGVKDSKKLSHKKRDKLNDILRNKYPYFIEIVSAEEIDAENIIRIEEKRSANIINNLSFDMAVLDCPSNSIDKYTNAVVNISGCRSLIVAEHKADVNHVAVSAASIIAKTERENLIKQLKKKYGDFGSGYTSDKKTIEFLYNNIGKACDCIFRKSWSTYQEAMKCLK